MNEKEINWLLELNNKADKILRDYRNKGNNIEWALLWLAQLHKSILEKDNEKHNSAFIWFKNAKTRSKEFEEVFDIVNTMTSKL